MNTNTLSDQLVMQWNELLSRVAELLEVPVALIMKLNGPHLSVFNKSLNKENPYEIGDSECWERSGLYCETVIKAESELCVPNALADPVWDHNPDIKLNMIAYLGLPIKNVDDSVFGTVCVLDSKENTFGTKARAMLSSLKHLFELQLRMLSQQKEHDHKEAFKEQALMTMGLAHELNTPLGVSVTSASMLSESAEQLSRLLQQNPVLLPQVQKQAACIHQAADLLSRNLHHIDDKIDRLKQSIVQGHDGVTRVCRITDVFKSLESVWESSLAMHNVVLNIDVEQSADVLLYLKPASLIEALNHLITNAIEHAFSGVDRPTITIAVKVKQAELKLRFSDNGVGVELVHPEDIFAPFYSTKKQVAGSGLGLAHVKRIAMNDLGGTVYVNCNQSGLGIMLRFPVTHAQSEPIED
ncbi:sensor histidine kinase [Pseudoalteromonas rubra]|uniref:sensor histidine kinase n=1 Tax=Pseudoalteromonas rubra TaxID=43658 RepID=UPI000F7774AE|nr:GAF domain-containing sensor histidine kinase [Pseudoalteromonas rubra]